MPPVYTLAPDVHRLAKELIDEEAEFGRLRGMPMLFVSVEPTQKRGMTRVLGKTDIVSGKNALMYWTALKKSDQGPFHRITVAAGPWLNMDDRRRRWLLRHELRHCGFKEVKKKGKEPEERPCLINHDVELFNADLADPAFPDVEYVVRMAQSMPQLELRFTEDRAA